MAQPKKRSYNISEEERKRRSERARQLVKQGKIGGVQKGAGRPKKERASEVVAEKIREDGERIYRALRKALNSKSDSVALKAALAMIQIEREEEEYQAKEEQRMYENLSREKLLEMVGQHIKKLEESGIDVRNLIKTQVTDDEGNPLEGEVLPP